MIVIRTMTTGRALIWALCVVQATVILVSAALLLSLIAVVVLFSPVCTRQL